MFNPLKMNPVEKRLLIGGLANSVIYYGNLYAMNNPAYPAEIKSRLEPHMPRNGEIIGSLAPPAALWVTKKIVKSPTTKEKVGDMTFGSILYGIPNFVHDVVCQTAYQTGVDSKPVAATARISSAMAQVRYTQTITPQPVRMTPSMGKYTIVG